MSKLPDRDGSPNSKAPHAISIWKGSWLCINTSPLYWWATHLPISKPVSFPSRLSKIYQCSLIGHFSKNLAVLNWPRNITLPHIQNTLRKKKTTLLASDQHFLSSNLCTLTDVLQHVNVAVNQNFTSPHPRVCTKLKPSLSSGTWPPAYTGGPAYFAVQAERTRLFHRSLDRKTVLAEQLNKISQHLNTLWDKTDTFWVSFVDVSFEVTPVSGPVTAMGAGKLSGSRIETGTIRSSSPH